MKISHLTVFILAILLIISCSSTIQIAIQTRDSIQEMAIHNAVLDFSTNCNLFKKDSIFSVSFKDSLYGLKLKQTDKRNFSWERAELYENIVTVSIIAHRISEDCEECCDKFLYTKETTVGSKGKLPSRYIEKDGKLFYWWDKDYVLTEEMLAILWKHNLLCDDTKGLIGFSDFSTDDQLKGADYYYCKNDLSKYRRVLTNIGLGYYNPPKLKCQ